MMDRWQYDIVSFEHQPFRYVKIIGHGNSVSDHNSIIEVSWYYPDIDSEYHQREIASVSASSYNKTNTPQHAIDGNLATHWTGSNGEYLQLDLGYLDTVENVKIAWLSGNKRRADYNIELSIDGVGSSPSFGPGLSLSTIG